MGIGYAILRAPLSLYYSKCFTIGLGLRTTLARIGQGANDETSTVQTDVKPSNTSLL